MFGNLSQLANSYHMIWKPLFYAFHPIFDSREEFYYFLVYVDFKLILIKKLLRSIKVAWLDLIVEIFRSDIMN